MTKTCDEHALQELIRAMQSDEDQIARVDDLLESCPDDGRLHFLRGSMLIGKNRLIEAHQSLRRAVDLAPDFDIARFQLGFFQLTSGEADRALETWGRLDRLAESHYLRKFADGLRCLIRDEFARTITILREGIALNNEVLPLNRDMQLIIERCEPLVTTSGDDSGATSETSLILQRFTDRSKVN